MLVSKKLALFLQQHSVAMAPNMRKSLAMLSTLNREWIDKALSTFRDNTELSIALTYVMYPIHLKLKETNDFIVKIEEKVLEPTKKAPAIDGAITALTGKHRPSTIMARKCMTCTADVDVTKFKDEISRKEYSISGMCQECQDKVFNIDDEPGGF